METFCSKNEKYFCWMLIYLQFKLKIETFFVGDQCFRSFKLIHLRFNPKVETFFRTPIFSRSRNMYFRKKFSPDCFEDQGFS